MTSVKYDPATGLLALAFGETVRLLDEDDFARAAAVVLECAARWTARHPCRGLGSNRKVGGRQTSTIHLAPQTPDQPNVDPTWSSAHLRRGCGP